MKIAICDDEKRMLLKHEEIVKNVLKENKKIADVVTFQSGDFLLYEIQEGEYFDLVLLDIEMPNKSGMEIAEKIKAHNSNILIIFVTSHNEYAIESFELSIYRFVLKSRIEEKLKLAVHDAVNFIELQKEKFYVISTATRYEKIPYRSIYYINKKGKNSLFITKDGETQIRKPLTQVYEELEKEEFIFIDRGCVVNLIYVMRVEDQEVYMKDGTVLFASKNRLKELRSTLNEYWGSQL